MSYWSKRQEKLNKALEKDEEALKKRLNRIYEEEARRLQKEIAALEEKTKGGEFTLVVALSYGGRDEIVRAAKNFNAEAQIVRTTKYTKFTKKFEGASRKGRSTWII